MDDLDGVPIEKLRWSKIDVPYCSLCAPVPTTVWKKKIFRHLEDYNSANMTDIHKI